MLGDQMTDISFKGKHYAKEVIFQAVRWYVSYALSYRNIEELLQERGYNIDHATIVLVNSKRTLSLDIFHTLLESYPHYSNEVVRCCNT